MELNTLPNLLAILTALSVMTERFTEIVKNIFFETFRKETSDKLAETPQATRWHALKIQLLATLGGLLSAAIADPAIQKALNQTEKQHWRILALGVLASGGSGLWNSVQTYALKLKDLKKAEAEAKKN